MKTQYLLKKQAFITKIMMQSNGTRKIISKVFIGMDTMKVSMMGIRRAITMDMMMLNGIVGDIIQT
jgi:hypothetical protein